MSVCIISTEWYESFDDFASLLNDPKSLVRNRALYILAANAQWDKENRFDFVISDFLSHITDEKPTTARQCIKALAQIGQAKPSYIPTILLSLHGADLSKYKDSMRPLIEKDIAETERILIHPICRPTDTAKSILPDKNTGEDAFIVLCFLFIAPGEFL